MDVDKRVQMAQWLLERQLQWIAAADTKVGALVAINTAALGGMAAAFGAVTVRSHMALGAFWLSAVLIGAGLLCAAISLVPRVDGPEKSLLFFGRVAAISEPDYQEALKRVSAEDLVADWASQIHRNAVIAAAKQRWVMYAMRWSFASVVPWAVAIAALLHGL